MTWKKELEFGLVDLTKTMNFSVTSNMVIGRSKWNPIKSKHLRGSFPIKKLQPPPVKKKVSQIQLMKLSELCGKAKSPTDEWLKIELQKVLTVNAIQANLFYISFFILFQY